MRFSHLIVLLLLCRPAIAQTPVYDLVPVPVTLTPQTGFFDLSNAHFGKTPEGFLFFQQWLKDNGIATTATTGKQKPNIVFHKSGSGSAKSDITIAGDQIEITASDDAGFFYAAQTLIQLAQRNGNTRIPAAHITDYPRFEWRGMHLDESRHFMGKAFVKKMIDWMGALKMNVFHWHLTDAQGWRIEIKKYPKLTNVGGWRPDRPGLLNSEADTARVGEPMTYGGFYSQQDIKEIVAYAAQRHITIIPEIEMPGHCTAALVAYPEYSCTGGPFALCCGAKNCQYPNFCVGNEKTYRFLEDILSEVMALFPSKYIHIGGDEVERDQWKKCKRCQHMKDSLGLADEAQLQVYFTKRIETFLIKKGRRLMGWDEIMEGGNLTPSAGVMVWRGDKIVDEATKNGHEAVLTHRYYFNQYQGNPENEPLAGGLLLIKDVYEYKPIPDGFPAAQSKKILGIQSCLWTENIFTPDAAEYMLFPRLLALAEVAWSPAERLNWDDFRQRIPGLMQWMTDQHLGYATSVFDPEIWIEPGEGGVICKIEQQIPHGTVHYTVNGAVPTQQSPVYTKPFTLDRSCEIMTASFWPGKQSKTVTRLYRPSMATGKDLKLAYPPNKQYNGDHPAILTDGLNGTLAFHDGNWCGFYGDDFDLEIDLKKEETIHRISISWLQIEGSWIFLPTEMNVEVSADHKNWHHVYSVTKDEIAALSSSAIKLVNVTIDEQDARYIHIVGKNPGQHPLYPDGKCWLFVDEVKVR